jgi:hypothetical protein
MKESPARGPLSAIVKFVADRVTSVAPSMFAVVARFCFATLVSTGLF